MRSIVSRPSSGVLDAAASESQHLYEMYEQRDEHAPGHVTASEARTSFAELVNRAAIKGERVRVMRHGHAVAAIIPIWDLERLEADDRARGGRSETFKELILTMPDLGEDADFLAPRELPREVL